MFLEVSSTVIWSTFLFAALTAYWISLFIAARRCAFKGPTESFPGKRSLVFPTTFQIAECFRIYSLLVIERTQVSAGLVVNSTSSVRWPSLCAFLLAIDLNDLLVVRSRCSALFSIGVIFVGLVQVHRVIGTALLSITRRMACLPGTAGSLEVIGNSHFRWKGLINPRFCLISGDRCDTLKINRNLKTCEPYSTSYSSESPVSDRPLFSYI